METTKEPIIPIQENTVKPETATDGLNEVNKLLSGYTEQLEVEPEKPKEKNGKKRGSKNVIEEPKPQVEINSVISGSLLILVIDLLIPNLIVFANNKMSKDKIKVKDLQLTAKQREELIPLADEASKKIALKADPLTTFLIGLVGIYGINLMGLKAGK